MTTPGTSASLAASCESLRRRCCGWGRISTDAADGHYVRVARKLARSLAQADGEAVEGEVWIDPTLSLASWADAERLFRSRRESIVRVTEPFALISQVQRSGGTLLNSLLDGHPELHVHPYELHIGHPTKADWPALDLDAGPDAWLELLSEPVLVKLFAAGYRKKPDMDEIEGYPTLPFTVVPTFIDHLFRLLCAERPPRSQREVIDHYLTAFFNSWIDNQGLRDVPKRWVAAFAPRTAWGSSRERFFADYPDGRVMALLRDPRAWYASASRFSGRYGELDEAVALWKRGAEEIAAAKRERPEAVLVIAYEALVRDPDRVMRALAEWLGISWSPTLLTPTFNRLPVRPNSSYDLTAPRIHDGPVERWHDVLDPETVATIAERTLDLHAEVRELSDLA
jgi:Sulfotransferase family